MSMNVDLVLTAVSKFAITHLDHTIASVVMDTDSTMTTIHVLVLD